MSIAGRHIEIDPSPYTRLQFDKHTLVIGHLLVCISLFELVCGDAEYCPFNEI